MNASNALEVNNLCSRKLWQMLKNSEWQSRQEREAIECELQNRRHYVREMNALGSSQFRLLSTVGQGQLRA